MKITFLKAFQSWNYRLYFAGQSVSLIGTWMQRTSVYWLIYEMTQSSFMLGVAVFAAQFPSFLFSIAGGVIADRYNRYHVLLLTQIASLIQAVLLTTLVLLDSYDVWHILTLSVLLGIINAFDVPARQALVYDMVDNKEHLPNAIALNSSMVHTARLIGPAIAGLVLQQYGAAICFLINGLSFIAVLTSLLFMKLPPYKPREHTSNAITDLKEGFGYLKNTPSISMVMMMLACMSLVALPYITLLPIYAKEIFNGEASVFGYLNSFIGLGAVSGAFYLASLKAGSNLKKVLFFNTLVFGLGLIVFSHLTSLPIALFVIAVTGFGMMSQTTISNTLIQTTVTPAMRGRVLSYYAMAFFGMQPIGGLLIGTLSHYVGAPNTILIEGLATLLIALIFFPFLRRDLLKRRHRMKLEQLEERSIETT
ncbi:MFS transporter [Ohtaekwangia kribbensis]|jgi:MFS family permease|uniref:MFS transporter n=1 Tax=Ohtaekwangia kribbensis TaxID=688913 RepID=A0ABW3K0R7_9BACT